jgi:hypothetical protein
MADGLQVDRSLEHGMHGVATAVDVLSVQLRIARKTTDLKHECIYRPIKQRRILSGVTCVDHGLAKAVTKVSADDVCLQRRQPNTAQTPFKKHISDRKY